MTDTTTQKALMGTGTGSEPLVKVSAISKSFGNHVVLHSVDFEVAPGEIVVLMGVSGSGKSTLLRIITGLTQADAGDVEIEGVPVIKDGTFLDEWRKKKRLVGMVFQQYTLWPHMDVLANLALGPKKLFKEKAAETRRRAEGVLQEVGMAHHLLSQPMSLSGGERQRVAIARALMMRPKIILCDEITSALDPPVAREVLGVLTKLKKDDGIACVIVTHDMAFASQAADRVVFVEDGRIVEQADPRVAFKNPTSEGLRKFVDAVRWSVEPEDESARK
jgi:polar amino acid transport system ATP-binding protein